MILSVRHVTDGHFSLDVNKVIVDLINLKFLDISEIVALKEEKNYKPNLSSTLSVKKLFALKM